MIGFSTPPMKTNNLHITTGYKAVAEMAYKINEVFPIYPCTPTSEMSALVEEWSTKKQENVFGDVPATFEMQSEAGVAGAMHGALLTGSLASTFTASQGLLLMIPNMYKIAGELTPNVIHVATRSIATHALSVLGDHSDIMATRQTGYAFLGSASVQEAQDFALISQAATLESRIPFVHFFDGFRTSHEINTIESISDDTIKQMMNVDLIEEHKNRALNSNNPVIRGTTQGADVFFQSREAQNVFYNTCPVIVQDTMDKFYTLTGRQYKLFEYVGHPQAEEILISMASSTETIEETVNYLNAQGGKIGLIKVRLYRPFSKNHLLQALPKSVTSIAVLDRTKEPGSSGEPLYLDIVQSLTDAFLNDEINELPKMVGGRYGLSSKEFTPSMVKAIFSNLSQDKPKNNFTVGITDDVTGLSLNVTENIQLLPNTYQTVFYQEKSKKSTEYINSILQLISKSNGYVQGYVACDYRKSNARNVAHIRVAPKPIKAAYIIEQADFVSCQHLGYIDNDNVIDTLKPNGTLLVNSQLTSKALWQTLSALKQQQILDKNIELFVVDLNKLNKTYLIDNQIVSGLNACFLSLKNDLIYTDEISDLRELIFKVDTSELDIDEPKIDDAFAKTLLGKLLENKGNDVLVSELPMDGTYATDTSKYNPSIKNDELPVWSPESCTQCGACSMACPQGAIRMKVYDDSYLDIAPSNFKLVKSLEADFDLLNYTLQVNPDQCNECNNCVDACPVKEALQLKKNNEILVSEKENWEYFENIPEFDRTIINTSKVSQQQLQEPLFKYSIGVEGCGEAPYLKLLSQLFGDRLLVANATGASSIFGGALPTTPWSKNKEGKGPAWANSLFEDNAEFGLGFRLALDQQQQDDKSVWIVGGDGWAYDIGYGGLDHVIASGKNVNILVLDNEVYDNTGGQMSKATPFGAEAKFAFGGKAKQKKDLGLLAMAYDNVYVASVAIGADQEQTLKAFNEAESFDGPSIIIGYCHSDSHGIDMKRPSRYHKAAVASGQWLLYRNDPRRSGEGLNNLQLDSDIPSIPIEEYLRLESRFQKLFEQDKNGLDFLMREIQDQIDKKYDRYTSLSSSVLGVKV